METFCVYLRQHNKIYNKGHWYRTGWNLGPPDSGMAPLASAINLTLSGLWQRVGGTLKPSSASGHQKKLTKLIHSVIEKFNELMEQGRPKLPMGIVKVFEPHCAEEMGHTSVTEVSELPRSQQEGSLLR